MTQASCDLYDYWKGRLSDLQHELKYAAHPINNYTSHELAFVQRRLRRAIAIARRALKAEEQAIRRATRK